MCVCMCVSIPTRCYCYCVKLIWVKQVLQLQILMTPMYHTAEIFASLLVLWKLQCLDALAKIKTTYVECNFWIHIKFIFYICSLLWISLKLWICTFLLTTKLFPLLCILLQLKCKYANMHWECLSKKAKVMLY